MKYTVKVDPINIQKPIFTVDFQTIDEVNEYCSKLENKPVYFYVIDKDAK